MSTPGIAITSGLRSIAVGANCVIPFVYKVGEWEFKNTRQAMVMAVRRESSGEWMGAKQRRAGGVAERKTFQMVWDEAGCCVTRLS